MAPLTRTVTASASPGRAKLGTFLPGTAAVSRARSSSCRATDEQARGCAADRACAPVPDPAGLGQGGCRPRGQGHAGSSPETRMPALGTPPFRSGCHLWQNGARGGGRGSSFQCMAGVAAGAAVKCRGRCKPRQRRWRAPPALRRRAGIVARRATIQPVRSYSAAIVGPPAHSR